MLADYIRGKTFKKKLLLMEQIRGLFVNHSFVKTINSIQINDTVKVSGQFYFVVGYELMQNINTINPASDTSESC